MCTYALVAGFGPGRMYVIVAGRQAYLTVSGHRSPPAATWVLTYAHGGYTFCGGVSGRFGASSRRSVYQMSLLSILLGRNHVVISYARYIALCSHLRPPPQPLANVRCRAGQHFLCGDSICGLSLLVFARALCGGLRAPLSVSGALTWSRLGFIGATQQTVRQFLQKQICYTVEILVDTGELSFEQVSRPARHMEL